MKLEEDHELNIFEKPCMIAIPHGISDYIGFAVKEQDDQISASHYLKHERVFKWARAYQIQIFTNMETNSYIESWHNQLKTNYLQRKRNRRLDRLIFILVDDVHADFMHNTARMAANIGRMSSETRETRKRIITAEEINELSLEDMAQKVHIDEEACYIVKCFTTQATFNEIGICIWFIASIEAVWFTAKIDCHDNNKRNVTVYLQHYLGIDSSLRIHTKGETALIQNTLEINHIEAITDSYDVPQSEVLSEAGDRTDEVLTNITNTVTNI
ncbi:hypothetical protein RMATCC62417_02577 [Rhizopus microsporus]|nr:hypothetical protein RMATCC62417_02577 [Rhizopus microsporus]